MSFDHGPSNVLPRGTDGSAYGANLNTAVQSGAVSLATVKTSVKNVFRLRMLTQMESSLSDPCTSPADMGYAKIPFSVVDSAQHRQLARDAAAASAVLMTNYDKTLPIGSPPPAVGEAKPVTVAIIGEHTFGNWTKKIRNGCFHFNDTDRSQCTPFWQVVPGEVLGGA